ncbi:MAG TPA: radical SAM protein [Vicinamibacterales bacterium]|nr:radical SAM protein [Vicinamibacterales bacterium]
MNGLTDWAYKRVYEGLNYRLRTLNGGRWASRCRPTSIILLLTELCNARCVHCDIWKNRGKEDSPTLDQWKTVLSDLRNWLGPVQVSLSGGEALLRPLTPELVAHGSSIGLFLEILTHGYWDDQARIEKLAMANPWRITISLDGLGETHNKIRGREHFFEKTETTIRNLQKLRRERNLGYTIRLKNVVMSHNLDDVPQLAHYAREGGMEVFYQAIEQNYNTEEDPRWWESSANWPTDTEKAVAVVEKLIRLKREGLPIANSSGQLEAMIPYFRNPAGWRLAVQSHSAHEGTKVCDAITMLQLQANGDVTICPSIKPIANVKSAPIREIWENRPRVWEDGCCLERRCTDVEQRTHDLVLHT